MHDAEKILRDLSGPIREKDTLTRDTGLAKDLYHGLGFKDSPALGSAVSAVGLGTLTAALWKILDRHPGKGFGIGALAGGAATLPFAIAGAHEKKAALNTSYFDSPVLKSNLQNFMPLTKTFDDRARTAIADTLRSSAQIRNIKDLTSNQPKGYVTVPDVVRAGFSAGLGNMGARLFGQMLGLRDPNSLAPIGTYGGGAMSLAHSLGYLR